MSADVPRDQAVAESAAIAESSTQVSLAPGVETTTLFHDPAVAAYLEMLGSDAPALAASIAKVWAEFRDRTRETNRRAFGLP